MSKVRMINTRFWSDNFIREHLNPLDRYLFLYFLTNEKTNICGVYELPLSTIASETGLDKEMLVKMMKRLERKVDYFDGWVVVRNFVRYQNTDSPTIKRGIEKAMDEIPPRIRVFVEKGIQYPYPSHTLSIQPEESESKLESESKGEAFTPSMVAKSFFEKGNHYDEYTNSIMQVVPKDVAEREISKFIDYWTEPNKSGTRVRWQQENTFDVGRRLKRWFSGIKNYQQHNAKEILA